MKLNFKDGKGDKVHILIDGEYKFTVDKTYFIGLGLYQNMEIDEDELSELTENIDCRRAFNQAVAYLSRRDHSEKELLIKLRQKGYDEGAVKAVEKLKNGGYIDDRRFSVMYVRELTEVKKFGRNRVRQELMRKGISNDIISDVLEEYEFDNNSITDVIKRKYYRYLGDEKGIKKAVNGLLRMGYSYSEIKSALENACNEEILTESEVEDE